MNFALRQWFLGFGLGAAMLAYGADFTPFSNAEAIELLKPGRQLTFTGCASGKQNVVSLTGADSYVTKVDSVRDTTGRWWVDDSGRLCMTKITGKGLEGCRSILHADERLAIQLLSCPGPVDLTVQ